MADDAPEVEATLSCRENTDEVVDIVRRMGSIFFEGPASVNRYGFDGEGEPDDEMAPELDDPTFTGRFWLATARPGVWCWAAAAARTGVAPLESGVSATGGLESEDRELAVLLIVVGFVEVEVVAAEAEEAAVTAVEVVAEVVTVTGTPTAIWVSFRISAGALFDFKKLMNCTEGFFLKAGKSCSAWFDCR